MASLLNNLAWINLSNPVALWWLFLVSFSILNIILWTFTKAYYYPQSLIKKFNFKKLSHHDIIWYSAFYVFGCAYRSVFTKADVQRICLFDTWFSSVFFGRSIATVAEISFVIQWAIILRMLAELTGNSRVLKISKIIVPLILIAECFSWFAVITTNYLGNSIEESTWTITYIFILIAMWSLRRHFKGAMLFVLNTSIFFNLLYILFMIFVDVHMYVTRLISDLKNSKTYFGFYDGLYNLNHYWKVTYDIQDWKTEIPWMSLYFSFAVLVSIGLCYIPSKSNKISKYLK